MKHREHHPEYVEGCFGCQAMTQQFVGERTPISKDPDRNPDFDAYYRLRKSGTQPPQINGSAALEAACTDKIEVSMAKPARSSKELRLIREGVERSHGLGLIPQTGNFSADGQ